MSEDFVQRKLDELKQELAKQFKNEFDLVFEQMRTLKTALAEQGTEILELKKNTSDLQTALNQTKEDNDALQRKKQRSQRKDR